MSGRPFVIIIFEKVLNGAPVATAERVWYHVPRVGDFIDVGGVFGYADEVRWDDAIVKITVKEHPRGD